MKIMNYLGIDWGEVRIGLALADGETKIATPFKIVANINEVVKVIDEEEIDLVVLGKPLSMKNDDRQAGGQITNEKYNEFVKDLKAKIKIPLGLVDERLSSKAADALVGNKKTKASRDTIAAMIILQSFLDRKR